MIRKVKEGEITWLPELTHSDIPHPLPNGISVHLRRDELGLEVQGVVGAIPLRNGDTLHIIPKIGQINFLRLLFKAEGVQRDLEDAYNEFVKYSVDDEENIDSIVSRQLLYCAEEILKWSPQVGRVSHRHAGYFAAGRIDPVATTLNITSHKEEPVVYYSKDKTEDIPENRVITEALIRAWPVLNETTRYYLSSVYDRWVRRFSCSSNLDSDIEYVEGRFAANYYGGPRDYYRKALMLSQIVLGSSGIGFSEAASVEGDAILLNTAEIYEKYLRNVISEAYSDDGYVVTKGGVGVASLYTDGSYEVVPDIVISKDNKTLLIADAKYKNPTAGDHYQMAAYLAVYGLKRGLLLSPLVDGKEVIIREYATSQKVVVRELYLPMANLTATEEFLGSLIGRFST